MSLMNTHALVPTARAACPPTPGRERMSLDGQVPVPWMGRVTARTCREGGTSLAARMGVVVLPFKGTWDTFGSGSVG